MLISVLIFVIIALICGALLGLAAVRWATREDPLVEKINALLPQTQCG
ncbi:MAG: electron transport complex subunit RsxB, partial [Gammaproteobacteria bacterium]|nr:electron transport complex subunit RsxB [Gammaproteobacteria bacterium]